MMKKRIALMLAVVMTFSMFTTAFATIPDPIQSSEAIGEGTVQPAVALPPPELSAIAPTAANLHFIVDPFGVTTLNVNDNLLEGARNDVLFSGGSTLGAVNKSSVPVVLTTNLHVSTAQNANVVYAGGDVVRHDAPNIMFWLEPASAPISTIPALTAPIAGAGQVVPFTAVAGGADVHFLLDALPHWPRVTATQPAIVVEWEEVDGAEPTGVAFNIGGVFNHLANWTTGDVNLVINVTHGIRPVAGTATGIITHPTIPSLITAGNNVTEAATGVVSLNLVDLPDVPIDGGDGHIYVGTGPGFRPGDIVTAINNAKNWIHPETNALVVGEATVTIPRGAGTGLSIPFNFGTYDYSDTYMFIGFNVENEHFRVEPGRIHFIGPAWNLVGLLDTELYVVLGGQHGTIFQINFVIEG